MKKLTALLTLLFSISSFAAIDALNFSSPQQESDYHALTQELRCPQCQNNNIADSNATIAVDMRQKVFELLQEGHSKEEVVKYMVERYGHFVTYNPPVTPLTLALWLVPVLLVAGGLFLVFRRKAKAKEKVEEPLSPEELERLKKILEEKA
ncbi:cytochrome c-type biogenesis protein [Pasteurella sp. PK-2025]|uniref:cytochrome c-type biogenesis protein n=1 Tax=Pasteurella sp. PK-2025 TaxID=3413133 RepID=UPI003C75EB90